MVQNFPCTLFVVCIELTHWKRPWCWEWLKARGEGNDRGWDGWMVLPTQWTWAWINSGSWWWTGKPDMLRSMGLQRVRHNWATELNQECYELQEQSFLLHQPVCETVLKMCVWVALSFLILVTPWTLAHQATLTMVFSRREYWSGLPFPSPGDLPDPWIKAKSTSFQADS